MLDQPQPGVLLSGDAARRLAEAMINLLRTRP